MDQSQLWQSILEQLQQEVPRASFDSWVRDTQAVSFDSNILRVVAQNEYARNWLQGRVEEIASRLLSELVETKAQVAFILKEELENAEEEEEQETEKRFSADIPYETKYQNEVRPERVVVLEGYALRMLEHGDISPKDMSLWVGFRQAVYQNWKKGNGTVKNIPFWEVLRFVNMSRASFFRETSGKDSLVNGLVEVVPVPADAPANDRRIDNARRYEVHMIPRLTRRDSAVLQEILRRDVCMAATHQEANTIAMATLQRLKDEEPAEYLAQFPKLEVREDQSRSMPEIVRRVLDIQGELPEELKVKAGKVTDHILLGFGKVLITHYFLQVLTRKFNLTHPQTWAIIALRDRCWYDHEKRAQKDFALVRGGQSEIGAWVGVDRKTVGRWLQDPSFATFVQVRDAKTMGLSEEWVGQNAVFRVRQVEPLEIGGWDKMSTDAGQSETHPGTDQDLELDKVSTDVGQSEYRPGTKRASMRDKVSTDLGQNEHLLNNLNKPQESHNKPQGSPPAAPPAGRAGIRAFWDLDFLLENNNIQPGSRKHLLITNKKQWGRDLATLSTGFVSWLLYGYSPEGLGLKDPVALALRRLNENAHAGAGGMFDRLANLKPYGLLALFEVDLAGLDLGEGVEADMYRLKFSRLLPEYKRELYWRLSGFPDTQQHERNKSLSRQT